MPSLQVRSAVSWRERQLSIASNQFPLLAVDDTYEAFQQLARNWRRRLNPRVVAVAGSPHERSLVVDVCSVILKEQFNVVSHDEGTVGLCSALRCRSQKGADNDC